MNITITFGLVYTEEEGQNWTVLVEDLLKKCTGYETLLVRLYNRMVLRCILKFPCEQKGPYATQNQAQSHKP